MMEKLHSQKATLDQVLQQRKSDQVSMGKTKTGQSSQAARCKIPTRSPQAVVQSGTGSNRKMMSPGASSTPMMWCLDESDEDVLVAEEELEIVETTTTTDSSNLSGGALSSDSSSLRRLGQACDH